MSGNGPAADAVETGTGPSATSGPGSVLVVDDEVNQRSALARMLNSWGYVTETAENGSDALEKLAVFPADAIVQDLKMPVMSGMALLEELRRTGAAPPAIVLTAFGSVEKAVETVRDLGAFWYLEKPVRPKELRVILERAIEQRRLAEHSERMERELSSHGVPGGMVAQSAGGRAV